MSTDWRYFDNRLRDRGVSDRCPICSRSIWLPADRWIVLGASDRRDQDGGTAPFSLLAFVCSNCGFVRLHVPDVLEAETVAAAAEADSELEAARAVEHIVRAQD